ncbi:MAG: Hsp70 family protein [Treponema sp.]|nr:Hsp70 family protein [Treponema sp.]
MESTIGIKIANGEFYSIVEENSQVKKRLVLTTVHDKQRSVQIDLFKSYTRTMADALYIGSLVVENIKPRPKGEPSIELVIASTHNGEITAEAVDMDNSVQGEHNTLKVSLKSLDEDSRDLEIPDFELEQDESPPTGLFEKAAKVQQQEEKKRGFPWLVVICILLILIAIGFAIWFFLLKGKWGGENTASQAPKTTAVTQQPAQPAPPPAVPPPAPAQSQAAQTPAAPPAPPPAAPAPAPAVKAPPPVIQAPAKAPAVKPQVSRKRPTPPVASYKVPSVIPKEGAPYKIRWGDTLWDIACAFYRNPWLYPRIARFNNIRNPDLIISGTTIRIPPRN